MAETTTLSILENPFFAYILLPFLLIFVIVYSVLEKAQILGDNKRAANVIVAAIISFIFVGVPRIVGLTLKIIPVISLILIMLLCLFLLFGFANIDLKAKWLQIVLGIVLGIALICTILWSVGVLDKLKIAWSSEAAQYLIFFALFGGALALIVSTSPKQHSSSSQA